MPTEGILTPANNAEFTTPVESYFILCHKPNSTTE